jgi:hypothetical protein
MSRCCIAPRFVRLSRLIDLARANAGAPEGGRGDWGIVEEGLELPDAQLGREGECSSAG